MQIASLKEQFKTAAETAKPLIDVELAAAEQALARAKAIANEYGVPFGSCVVDNTSDVYWPSSYRTKFGQLQFEFGEDNYSEFVEQLTEVWAYNAGFGGWQKSYC